MAKTFKVGDKVRILDASKIFIPFGEDAVAKALKNGKVFEIVQIDLDEDARIYVPGRNLPFLITKEEFNAIELVDASPTKKKRIEALESEVEALKSRIEALEKAKEIDISARIAEKKTPNQRRKAVIERAKAFVADVEKGALCNDDMKAEIGVGNLTYSIHTTKPEYHVNKEKRVVTVLIKGANYGRLFEKASARCAPGDVFNEHIGKAIALAKAYGLECPKEFTDAPQPDKLVVGHATTGNYGVGNGKINRVFAEMAFIDSEHGYWDEVIKSNNVLASLDDTEAQYE